MWVCREGESGRNEFLRGPFALFGMRNGAKLVRNLGKPVLFLRHSFRSIYRKLFTYINKMQRIPKIYTVYSATP